MAAIKGRTAEEVARAVDAGICLVGENYVQEAEGLFKVIGSRVRWHFIGHLQRNKTSKAVSLFDMIETVDSLSLAQEINRHCSNAGGPKPVLVEVNSGREPQKHGVFPENVEGLLRDITVLPFVKVCGLMTIGPVREDPAEIHPYFRETRRLYENLARLALPSVAMNYLSMGMSYSYRQAIEEGANIVRIGRKIFQE